MKSLHSAARVKRPNLRPSLSGFLLFTLLMIPLAAHAQSSPFDTGLTSIHRGATAAHSERPNSRFLRIPQRDYSSS